MEINFILIFFIVGVIADITWWRINYSKYEKGLEAHEHYHIGLEIAIIASLLNIEMLVGLSFAFIIAEWFQDHPFAINSKHFKKSTAIGILLFVGLVIVSIIGN